MEQALNELYEKADELFAYHVGDEIKVNGIDFYVIADSPATQDYVVALKKDFLTVAEVILYGESIPITSSDAGYWGVKFDATCDHISQDKCHTYDGSTTKTVLERWSSDKFQYNELKEINGYTTRLINNDEYNSISNEEVWRYNSNFNYWTMTDKGISIGYVVKNNGQISTAYTDVAYGHIRPVINVYKSAIQKTN